MTENPWFSKVSRQEMRNAQELRFGDAEFAAHTPNQDRGLIIPKRKLIVVADGVGSRKKSDLAAQRAVDIVAERTEVMPPDKDLTPDDLHEFMGDTFRLAQQDITAMDKGDKRGPQTTLTVVKILGDVAHAYSVGNSRAYSLYPGEKLTPLTVDDDVIDFAFGNNEYAAALRKELDNATRWDQLSKDRIDFDHPAMLKRYHPGTDGEEGNYKFQLAYWSTEQELWENRPYLTQVLGGKVRHLRYGAVQLLPSTRLIVATDALQNLTQDQLHEIAAGYEDPQEAAEQMKRGSVWIGSQPAQEGFLPRRVDDARILVADVPK